MIPTPQDPSAFQELARLLTGRLVLPTVLPMRMCVVSGMVGSRRVPQHSFAVPLSRTSCTPCAGRVRTGLCSPYGVGDMMLQDAPCARMGS